MSNILQNGFPSMEEIQATGCFPSNERFAKGPVAVVECVQEIPCNPCETSCPAKAISVGNPITNRPTFQEERCTGCGLCVARCSGLAIFVVNKVYSQTEATVSFPHEYYPLPAKGQTVGLVNREGQEVCEGRVVQINQAKANDKTVVITAAMPAAFADVVRGMKRLPYTP